MKAAFIGDLHFYDGNVKSHKDYFKNSLDCMDRYTKELEKERPDYIFLSGDIIGFTERVTKTRLGLSIFSAYLQRWSSICSGRLYSIAGNHDYTKGDSLSDFDLLTQLGIIKTASHVDVGTVRVHLLNYGEERNPIDLDESKHNIALMHSTLLVDGQTDWFFNSPEGVLLSSLKNLKGVDLVLAGHIHQPSPRTCSTSIEDKNIDLIYLGNATRPRKMDNWSACYIAYITSDIGTGDVKLDINPMKLAPLSEIWHEGILEDPEEANSLMETTPVVDIALLTQILDDLGPSIMGSEFDYRTQIRRLAGVDKDAADVAVHYIDLADEHAKVMG